MSEEHSTPTQQGRRRSFFGRPFRYSIASTYSSASINTILPEYSTTTIADTNSEITPPDFNEAEPSAFSINYIQSSSSTITSGTNLSPTGASSSFESSALFHFSEATPPRYSYNPGSATTANFPAEVSEDAAKSEYFYPIRATKSWSTLRLFSRDPGFDLADGSQKKLKIPRVWGGQAVEGMLELNLESSLAIQKILITLKGKIVTGSFEGGSYTFLNHDFILWDKNYGDPRPTSMGTDKGKGKSKFDGKFIGKHTFPFSFPFPENVDMEGSLAKNTVLPFNLLPTPTPPSSASLPSSLEKRPYTDSSPTSPTFPPTSPRYATLFKDDLWADEKTDGPSGSQIRLEKTTNREESLTTILSTNRTCPTPQSFLESRVAVNVQYGLTVQIVHGRFRPDNKIKAEISHVPSIEPPPSSELRQQAYINGGIPPGPVIDPQGWLALPPIVVEGTIGGNGGKPVRINCQLHLAQPLSYTRGTSIPCYFDLAGEDAKALDAFYTPKSPNIRLTRRIRHWIPHGAIPLHEEEDTRGTRDRSTPTTTAGENYHSGRVPSTCTSNVGSLKTLDHEIGRAVWWVPPKDVPQQPNLRRLEGEIHLNSNLQPSCVCPQFSVEYFVEVLPLKSRLFDAKVAPGQNLPSKDGALLSHMVEIATLYPKDGPVPVPFSRPTDTPIKPMDRGMLKEIDD